MNEWYEQFKANDVVNTNDFIKLRTGMTQMLAKFNNYNIPRICEWEVINYPVNSILYLEKINDTIDNINNFKIYYFEPEGWRDIDKYKIIKNLTYEEMNDLFFDTKLGYDNVEEILNKNIWDVNYLLNWNEDSDIEWEE